MNTQFLSREEQARITAAADGVPLSAARVATISFDAADSLVEASAASEMALVGGITPTGRYRVLNEIARGGMGAVFRVFDAALERPLAIKVLLGPAEPDGAAFRGRDQRFLEEARITGQLQHPGIAPVHEIGRLPDGRPFFAMKLIEGRTLAELLKARSSPQSELPRFLKIFEQITQTLAYAHAQGVIHRDLKPLNVMVGAFGEVQVMDWGLARRLGGDAPSQAPGQERADAATSDTREDSPTARPPDDTDRLTRAGQVLGTPAYMPPEQALGRIAALDVRSDVFGLGSILCEILSGAPPYQGRDSVEILQNAQRADLSHVLERLGASGADQELVELCCECLQPDPARRPADAGAVAARVGGYLSNVQQRLEQARIEKAGAEVQAREERKRRRLAVGLAGLVVLLVAGAAAAGVWYFRDRAQRDAETALRATYLEREISAALDDVQRIRMDLHRRLQEPREAAQLLSDLEEWRRLAEASHAALQRGEALAASGQETLPSGLRARLAMAAQEWQEDERNRLFILDLDGVRMAASTTRENNYDPRRAAPKLAQLFDAAGYDVAQGDIAAVAARIEDSPVRLLLAASLDFWASATDDDQLRPRLLEVARRADPDPWRDRFRQLDVWEDGVGLAKLAKDVNPADQSPPILSALAERLIVTREEAAPFLRRAMLEHPRDFWLYVDLALASSDAAEQANAFRAALAVRPQAAGAYNGLGGRLRDLGERDEAWICFRKARDLDPQYAEPYINLGVMCYDEQRVQEAVDYLKRAIELDSASADGFYNLGIAYHEQGRFEDAAACGERAAELLPKDANILGNLGMALMALRKFADAQRRFRQAVEFSPRAANAHVNLGQALHAQGQLESAAACYRHALEIDPRHAGALADLGKALHELGQKDEALACYRRAVEIDPKLAAAQYNLGNALCERGKFAEAVACFNRALEIDPTDPDVWCNLGHARRQMNDFKAAIVAFRRGHELGSRREGWPYPSDLWLADAERLAKLDERLSLVLEQQSKPANVQEQLFLAEFCVRHKGLHRQALDWYRQAFAADSSLLDDLSGGHRSNAAHAAVLAAAGQGADVETFTDQQRDELRQEARQWLSADLAAIESLLERQPDAKSAVLRTLTRWQRDPRLASVRDEAALSPLPTAEQGEWREFWAGVAALHGRAMK